MRTVIKILIFAAYMYIIYKYLLETLILRVRDVKSEEQLYKRISIVYSHFRVAINFWLIVLICFGLSQYLYIAVNGDAVAIMFKLVLGIVIVFMIMLLLYFWIGDLIVKIKKAYLKSKLITKYGIEFKNYQETQQLIFDKGGNFKYEIRDRRFRNTFLVDKEGIISSIYFHIDDDTVHQIGDKIDISDTRNIYIPAETRGEMKRYEVTRKYMLEHSL